jgi:1-acyl-sn-glycerol-3-phosphate acyltransferase
MSSRIGATLPRPGSLAGPRLPGAWSTGARATRRAIRSLELVRAARRDFVRPAGSDPTLDRADVSALSRLFASLCAAHDWRIRVSGPIPKGPVVLVANHVSYLDPVVLVGLVPALPVSKREVARWPLIGGVARRHGVLFVERADPRSGASVLRRARRALSRGLSVLNFPEGTTTNGEQVLPFRRGIFGVARHARVPVVPVALRFDDPELAWFGDALFLPHYARLLARSDATVRIRFGGPLTPERYGGAADLADEARAAVEHMLRAD